MTPHPVVSNASPLIALNQIGRLHLLRDLFTEVLVPSAVIREIKSIRDPPTWIVEHKIAGTVGSSISTQSLGAGETEAIQLAVEKRARWLILDERAARRLAGKLGIPLIGTLGVLLAAKRHGLVPSVRFELDALAKSGFRVSPNLVARVLKDAAEE